MVFQHAFVIVDVDKKKIRKAVRKTCAERRRITFLKDVNIRQEKVIKLVISDQISGDISRMES